MTALLDRFLPSPALRQVDHAAVDADAARAWDFARHVDLYQMRSARLLFGLRTLPDWLGARLHGKPTGPLPRAQIEDFTKPGMGFQILGEEPGREIVVGAIGKVWKAEIPFVTVAPEHYAEFDDAGFAKVAWAIAVDPRSGGGAWISIDVRVGFTDAEASAHFAPYWRLIGRFSHLIRRALLRRARATLGAADDEARALAGDELLPAAQLQLTHAVDIEAPPERIWPWLLQIGADRAGWYSWDRLDNGGVPSAKKVVPGLQHLRVGELIHGLPGNPRSSFAVLRIDPRQALVLGSPALLPGGAPDGTEDSPPFVDSWAFALDPIGAGATRLLARVRGAYAPTLKMALLKPALLTAHEIMERRQLQNLKRRVEGQA